MAGVSEKMHQRVTITLPQQTVRLLNRAAQKGDRSRFIDEAIRRHIAQSNRAKLKSELEEESRLWADRDLHIADEWFPIDEETCPKGP